LYGEDVTRFNKGWHVGQYTTLNSGAVTQLISRCIQECQKVGERGDETYYDRTVRLSNAKLASRVGY